MLRDKDLSKEVLTFDAYSLSLMLESIFENSKGDIENQQFLREATDHLFDESKSFFLKLLLIYMLFFVVPLITQIFSQNPVVVIVCMTSCQTMQTFLLVMEVIQMIELKQSYLKDKWNWFDLMQISITTYLTVTRI
jgi:hypothetical protein